MRLKAFMLTYLLFLCVLFSIIGIVSVYMTDSQMNMLREKSTREYQTISASFTRDITVLYGQSAGMGFSNALDSLVRGYRRYYSNYGIDIFLTSTSRMDTVSENNAQLAFILLGQEHFIHIAGALPPPFAHFLLEYYLDITASIYEMRNIQLILLALSVAFAMITALGLYFILLRIFKPLNNVASVSKQIASGKYGERIPIDGTNELAVMAQNFNQMAEAVETQIVGKQQFIDNFAHEIRTPLTSIYGYAEYLQRAPFDESELIDSTQTIMDEASHMQKIANSLLELATLRNYTPVKTEIGLRKLFEDVTRSIWQGHPGVKLESETEVKYLHAQEDLIRSLILNLCYNAIKACDPADTLITLMAHRYGNKIVISVADNGSGISPENLKKIAEPFFRVDNVRNRAGGGVGLGLAICKQIAESHGATLAIESELDEGTTVKIEFAER